jgi:hypothetical protein
VAVGTEDGTFDEFIPNPQTREDICAQLDLLLRGVEVV